MKSEIDLSDVSNCFSSQGIYIRLENIDREKKKKKEIIFSRNFILPFILHAMINIAYVESDESTFLEGSARSIASLNHRAARIKKRRKGWRRGEKGTYIWRIRESNQLFEETLHRRYERRNFPLRIQPHFSVADINQVEARLNKLCGDFRVRLVEALALKNLTGKKKIGACTQRKTRKKNIYILYRSMRSRKQKYKHKFRLWYTDQNLGLERENLCIYFARPWISTSIDPFVGVQ